MGGRPRTDKKKVESAIMMYESKKYTVAEIEEATGIKKATLYRALRNKES
jgi:hypothetical protein